MNDTENKVKSKIESYEIKTTSTDILNAYNKEKKLKTVSLSSSINHSLRLLFLSH
jgi:hypothetical protein